MKNEAIFEQADRMMAPVRAMNEVAVEKTEKLVKLQANAFQSYAKMAIDHWRDALKVKDADSAKDFMSKQRAYVESVAEKANKDASAMMELGNDYVAEVQKILKDSAAKAGVSKAA
ncbi:MAG: phasin family protein [Gammaproteobacteria bacterium]|nr:phasin family protein [Gammaproteobacteria bacterium]